MTTYQAIQLAGKVRATGAMPANAPQCIPALVALLECIEQMRAVLPDERTVTMQMQLPMVGVHGGSDLRELVQRLKSEYRAMNTKAMSDPKTLSDEELTSELIGIAASFWFNSNKAILLEAVIRLRTRKEAVIPMHPASPASSAPK